MQFYAQPLFYISWTLWLLVSFVALRRLSPKPLLKFLQVFGGFLLATVAILSLFTLLTRDFKSGPSFFIDNYTYTIPAHQKEIIIGTAKDKSHITIENAFAAPAHLALRLRDTDFEIRNISGDKKVDVNGKYLNQVALHKNDEITIGTERIRVMAIGSPYPLGRAITLRLTRGGEKKAKTVVIRTLLNKTHTIPTSPTTIPGTLALEYQPHLTLMGSSIYYGIIFLMVLLFSIGLFLYLKNRLNGALLFLMAVAIPFGAGLIRARTMGAILLVGLVLFLYIEAKRKTNWQWGSILLLLLYASVFLLPILLRMNGDFLLKPTGLPKDNLPAITFTRGNESFDLRDKTETLTCGHPHPIILGHTGYDLTVDQKKVVLIPRDPEKIRTSESIAAIISDLSEVKPGNNYMHVKFPHTFQPVPAQQLGKPEIVIADTTGNRLTLTKRVNPNYHVYRDGLIRFIIFPFGAFLIGLFIFSTVSPKGGAKNVLFGKKSGVLVYQFVYFMLGLGYVLFGGLALYNNHYVKNFEKFRGGALPLFVALFLGFIFLSRYNRYLVFLFRVLRQRVYHIPLLIGLFLISLSRYGVVFFIAGAAYVITVFGFRLRHGIRNEFSNARSYPLDVKTLIETPVCDFESRENKRLFFGLGGFLNKKGWNCLLFADMLLLLALFFIVLQLFLGSELGVSVGGFFFLPIELGKILLTIYFADWVSRIDKGMSFSVFWVYGLVLIPFVLLIVFLKDFSPLIIFFFVFFYHLIRLKKPRLLLLLSLVLVLAVNFILFSNPGMVPKVVAKRISVWQNPWQDYDLSYQYINSVWLMKGSGTFGRAADGLHAAALVPLVEKDLTFSLVVGTLGMVGAGLLLLTLFLTAAVVKRKTGSSWHRYILEFLTVIFLAQCLVPAMDGVGILPLMGQPFPFLSYSSNMLLLFVLPFFLFMIITSTQPHPPTSPPSTYSPEPSPSTTTQTKTFWLHLFQKVESFHLFCLLSLFIAFLILLRLHSVVYPRDVEEKTDVVYMERFQDKGNLFKITLDNNRFWFTPIDSGVKVRGKDAGRRVEIETGDLVIIGDQTFQFRVYPGQYVYKEVFCQPLIQAFPSPGTIRYIGGFPASDRKKILSDRANRDLLTKLIIEIDAEAGQQPGPVLALKWDKKKKSLAVSPLIDGVVLAQGVDETRIPKNEIVTIGDEDILKIRSLFLKFEFRRVDGSDGLAISYREKGDFPYHSEIKPETAVLKSPDTGMVYDIHPVKETLFTGEKGLYAFNLRFSDFFSRLYIPDKVPRGKEGRQKSQVLRPAAYTLNASNFSQNQEMHDAEGRLLVFRSEVNGEPHRFLIDGIPQDIRSILGIKNQDDDSAGEIWGVDQIFSRLYKKGNLSDIRLTLNVEWQKIVWDAMKQQLESDREVEENSWLYRDLKQQLANQEARYSQTRDAKIQEKIRKTKAEIDKVKNRLYEATVVLMDPQGRILTAASYPYDEATLNALNPEIHPPYRRDTHPYLNRAWKWKYNPGSTAKILDAITFIDTKDRFPYLKSLLTPGSAYQRVPRYNLEGGEMLNGKEIPLSLVNFDGHTLPEGFCTLTGALTWSYNTYFTYLALHTNTVLTLDSTVYASPRAFISKSGVPVKKIYDDFPILEYAERLFMNRQINLLENFSDTPIHSALQRMPNDALMSIESVYPINAYTPANIAHYSIGQGDFQLTALENALISSTVLNNGVLYHPFIVEAVTVREGNDPRQPIYKTVTPDPEKRKIRVYSEAAATEIKEAMRQVVARGTAVGIFGDLNDCVVYAKTGTAETGVSKDNAVFTGFVKFNKSNKHLVFSVIVPRSGLGADIAGRLTSKIIRGIMDYERKKKSSSLLKSILK
ncbi:MAG: penicillin-binding transpeptidase domain-containing protein [Candidatus Omnitrophota bacterium]